MESTSNFGCLYCRSKKQILEQGSYQVQQQEGIALRPLIRRIAQEAFDLGSGATMIFTGFFYFELGVRSTRAQQGRRADGEIAAKRDDYTQKMNGLAMRASVKEHMGALAYLKAIRRAAQDSANMFYDSNTQPTEAQVLEAGNKVTKAAEAAPEFVKFINNVSPATQGMVSGIFGLN